MKREAPTRIKGRVGATVVGFASTALIVLTLSFGLPSSAAAATCTHKVVAAGDLTPPKSDINATGELAQRLNPDSAVLLGDLQYPTGTLSAFRKGFGQSSWMALSNRLFTVPGNHEYRDPGAAGYYAFFDGVAPYYITNLDCGWRLYALNSEISLSPQVAAVTKDLAKYPTAKVLVAWHRPRYSSGEHGNQPAMQKLMDAFAGRAGVALAGHDHHYERFALVGDVRPFVVGTGGSSGGGVTNVLSRSQFFLTGVPGVLSLTLSDQQVDWSFIDTSQVVRDRGTDSL